MTPDSTFIAIGLGFLVVILLSAYFIRREIFKHDSFKKDNRGQDEKY